MIEITQDVDWVPEGLAVVEYCGNVLVWGENCDKYIRVCKIAIIARNSLSPCGGQYPSVEQEKHFFHYSTPVMREVVHKSWFPWIKDWTDIEYVSFPDQVTKEQLNTALRKLQAKFNANQFRKPTS